MTTTIPPVVSLSLEEGVEESSQILYRLRSISNIFSLQHQLLVRLVAGVYYFIKSRINIRQ